MPTIIVTATGGDDRRGGHIDGNRTGSQTHRAGTYPMAHMLTELPNEELLRRRIDAAVRQQGPGGYRIKVDYYDLVAGCRCGAGNLLRRRGRHHRHRHDGGNRLLPRPHRAERKSRWSSPAQCGPGTWSEPTVPANLYNAISHRGVGRDDRVRHGPVASNDEIHAAREVTKLNSHRMDTSTRQCSACSASSMKGSSGSTASRRARSSPAPTPGPRPFDLSTITAEDLPTVEIAYNYQEAGGGAIREALLRTALPGSSPPAPAAACISSAMSAARTEVVAARRDLRHDHADRPGLGRQWRRRGRHPGRQPQRPARPPLLLLSLAFSDDIETIRGWSTPSAPAHRTCHAVCSNPKHANGRGLPRPFGFIRVIF